MAKFVPPNPPENLWPIRQVEDVFRTVPQEPEEFVAEFKAYCKGISTNNRDGELHITLAVQITDKYNAMPISDHPGVMFRVVATKKARLSREPKERL